MKLSQLFTKTRKDAPKDEVSKNAQLLIRAGYIHKEMAGAYAYLPLGLRVIEKIKQIVREEMNQLGSQELLMTTLQREELWSETDRWSDEQVDVWFKSQLKSGTEVGFGWSHEEPITAMMGDFVASYRDLPLSVYQFQTKLRNELRAKSGIMRGREFLMKDLYSYAQTEAQHQEFYDSVIKSYLKVFERVGLGEDTFLTFASGGDFTQFSHEFQTVTAAGEDTVYLDRERKLAVNEEVMDDGVLSQLKLKRENLEQVAAAEVGNIFSFGTSKSEQLNLYFTDEDGSQKPVVLGSYGIGISRLMGVIVEKFADERGLIWPQAVAPAQIHLVALGDSSSVTKQADKLYELLKQKYELIYDDRQESAGVKLADADLLGLPLRVLVSEKTLAEKAAEVKLRTAEQPELVKLTAIVKNLADKVQ